MDYKQTIEDIGNQLPDMLDSKKYMKTTIDITKKLCALEKYIDSLAKPVEAPKTTVQTTVVDDFITEDHKYRRYKNKWYRAVIVDPTHGCRGCHCKEDACCVFSNEDQPLCIDHSRIDGAWAIWAQMSIGEIAVMKNNYSI
jgi:hypothetical protein